MEEQITQLYIVPTPIGNLEDFTLRAIRILKEVDVVLAEDTRTSGKLLKHYEIKTRLESHHTFNEHQAVEKVIERLKQGKIFALVSDAGTPVISDPGFLLCRACVEHGIKFECLPGATAFVPALVKSGFPADKFFFEGFFPQKKGRQTKLEELQERKFTTVFYESPHRLLKTLKQFQEYFEESRQVSVSRELTKLYEETQTGTCAEVFAYFENKKIKGEIVLVLGGKEKG